MTDTLFEKLQAAYRRGVDFACWHFNTSEEKYMELWEFVPKAAYDYADKQTGSDAPPEYPVMQDRWRLIPKAEYKGPQTDDGKDVLIRELVAALADRDAEIEHLKLEMDGVDNAKEEIGRLLGLTEEFRWKRISAAIHEQKRLIRELVAALKHVRGLREQNRQNPEPVVEDALAKAKAQGFDP